MRTTLTLDDDVAAKLKSEVRRTGHSFKQVVNDLLRRELGRAKASARKPFKVRAKDLGLRPGLSYDNIGELLEIAEGPLHR